MVVEENENEEDKIEEEILAHEEKRRVKDQIGSEKGVIGAEIVEEMEKSYIDYAMSVIVQRALPSVEDGMKPVHRRILYAMHTLGLDASKPTRKSATVVGEVIGKYHPHGDMAVYDALVRLAQDFSMRYPLVHGQGNFGNIDGDSAAAHRYTEAKMSKITKTLLEDIEKDTVKMRPNFDNSLKEPETLPARFPNLLLNGATGIAVGMATNIPPHNLNEICDAIIAYIDNPNSTVEDLIQFVKGPDFPTGGYAMGPGIKEMYRTGKGKVIMRGRTKEEDVKGKPAIIITEIPYMVNKADLVKDIARLTTEKKFPDITDLRDESNKKGIRIYIELRKGVDPKYTLNKLFKLTRLQTNFDANILALVGNKPRVLTLLDVVREYVAYRKIVVTNRSKFELKKAEDRLEIVMGLLKALNNIDKIVAHIRKSASTQEAHDGLVMNFGLNSRQAKAVLEMRLQQLTNLEGTKLNEEEDKLRKVIAGLQTILGSESEVLKVIRKEVNDLKTEFGDDRKTVIIKKVEEFEEKDLIEKKDVVVMLSNSGYVKRMDVETYREQRRGGAGVTTGLKDEDFVKDLITCSTHDYLLFFTSRGRVYWLKANDVPAAERQSKGRSIANLLNLRDEEIANVMSMQDFESGYLMFATKLGQVKKLQVKDVSKPRSTGVRIMNLPPDGSDTIINVVRIVDSQQVLLITKEGQAIRFNSDDVRSMGRSSYGVRGIDLSGKDEVVSIEALPADGKGSILTITDKGYGKRSELDEYRITGRGGKGVINLKVTDKTGNIIKSLSVEDKDSVIATTTKGMVLRTNMKDIRVMGRNTQGVRIVNIKEGDSVADIVKVPEEEVVVSKEKSD